MRKVSSSGSSQQARARAVGGGEGHEKRGRGRETYELAHPMRGFSHRPPPWRMSQSMRHECEGTLAEDVTGGAGR